MRFSIVIPLHRDSAPFRLCLDHCLALDHDDFEVLVVSDRAVPLPADPRIRPVVGERSDDSSPAEKRDLAEAHATGDALAYLDDDAYPARDWLRVAEAALARGRGAGAGRTGGHAAGLVGAGAGGRRRLRVAARQRAPAVPLHPGPRARGGRLPCLQPDRRHRGGAHRGRVGVDLLRRRGHPLLRARSPSVGIRIHYRPDLVVYHHRRPVFRAHMRQIGNVGHHRGHFARVHPGTSLRPVYFLPLAGTLGLLGGAAAVVAARGARGAAVAGALAYAALGAVSPAGSARERGLFPAALVAHHMSYGLAFLRGLGTRTMVR